MPLGFPVLAGPFAGDQLHLWVTKGHISLWPMLAWGPLAPIQRPTLQVAATEAVGALVLDALCFLAQSFDI